MIESWRWYGPLDTITLPEIVQTGAQGVVTALHEIPYGEVWPQERIADRKAVIAAAGLHWNVVESLPIHEDIKRGAGNLAPLFANYRQSLKNLAECGIFTVCYNFMPVLDWTRTRLDAPLAGGATALRFDVVEMAAFEIHMLGRTGAEADYSPAVCAAAQTWFARASSDDKTILLQSIMAGLPGAFARYSVEELRKTLSIWQGISRDDLRANFVRFLAEIIPAADDLGMRLCVHPDDPPRDILSLPRIVSNAADIEWVLRQQISPANGLTLCSGSLGANPANDIPAIVQRFGERIHFAHLRNVKCEPDGSFQEAAHLTGDTDMVALVQGLLDEETRRQASGRKDTLIPFRPDHGHAMLDDLPRGSHPGYPLIGRMQGLAELRGVIAALEHNTPG